MTRSRISGRSTLGECRLPILIEKLGYKVERVRKEPRKERMGNLICWPQAMTFVLSLVGLHIANELARAWLSTVLGIRFSRFGTSFILPPTFNPSITSSTFPFNNAATAYPGVLLARNPFEMSLLHVISMQSGSRMADLNPSDGRKTILRTSTCLHMHGFICPFNQPFLTAQNVTRIIQAKHGLDK